MKKMILAAMATLAMSAVAHADFSGSQDELRNSPGYGGRPSAPSTNPNDIGNSQEELRRNGRSQRPIYTSCQEAEFGTELWWECRQLGLRN